MITKISNGMKDNGRLGLLFSLIFIAGILVSTYLLFTLPHHLVIYGGLTGTDMAWPVLTAPLISIGLTFIAAAAALFMTMQNRKEVVVYVEKKKEEVVAVQTNEEIAEQIQLDFNSFQEALAALKPSAELFQQALNLLCQQLQAGQGAVYTVKSGDNKRWLELTHGFAVAVSEESGNKIEWSEGLVGQAAASGKTIFLDEVPEGYINVLSGLGEASARYLLFVPSRKGNALVGVWEIALFNTLSKEQQEVVQRMIQYVTEKTN